MSKGNFLFFVVVAFVNSAAFAIGPTEITSVVKTGNYQINNLDVASFIRSNFTCDPVYASENDYDQGEGVPFDSNYCKVDGYSCTITVGFPVRDRDGNQVKTGFDTKNYKTDEASARAACNRDMENFENSVGSAPLKYSITLTDEPDVYYSHIAGVKQRVCHRTHNTHYTLTVDKIGETAYYSQELPVTTKDIVDIKECEPLTQYEVMCNGKPCGFIY